MPRARVWARELLGPPLRVLLQEGRQGGFFVGGALALLTLWVFLPLLQASGDVLAGDPETDAIRGLWSLDHLRHSLLPPETPLWSHRLNFPDGVLTLVLPWVTGLLLAPLGLLGGPVAGYNLAIAFLLWSAGLGTAALIRSLSGSWAAGLAAGGAMLAQPTLLHGIADGTPEHVAIWLLPLFLAAAGSAGATPRPAVGALAGALAGAAALDSPYHAVYGALFALFALSPTWLAALASRDRRPAALRTLAAMLAVAALFGGLLGGLFHVFPIEAKSGDESLRLLQQNAADLHTWWQFDWGGRGPRDPSLAPSVIPSLILGGAAGLALIGLPRSLPWLAVGLLTLSLSFGLNQRVPEELAVWLGPSGADLGRKMLRLNEQLYTLPGIDAVRFPRRWLVPAALAFLAAGGIGLGRLLQPLARLPHGGLVAMALGALLATGGVHQGLRASRFDLDFPLQELPPVAFADWIAARGGGAMVLLPQIRPAPKESRRGELPVFANLSPALSSSDVAYLQVRTGRPTIEYPSLKTLAPMRIDRDTYRLMRSWDDLARPALSGEPIPTSATDERHAAERAQVIGRLVAQGLSYVCVDVIAYGDEGAAILRAQLAPHTAEEKRFDDGDGVIVFALQSPQD